MDGWTNGYLEKDGWRDWKIAELERKIEKERKIER